MSAWQSFTAAAIASRRVAVLPCLWRCMVSVVSEPCVLPSAAKLGLLSKGSRGGFLQRGLSGRKAARSDYEEQQVLLGLKAVEKMKQMVLVSSRSQPTAVAPLDRSTCVRSPERNV